MRQHSRASQLQSAEKVASVIVGLGEFQKIERPKASELVALLARPFTLARAQIEFREFTDAAVVKGRNRYESEVLVSKKRNRRKTASATLSVAGKTHQ